MTAPDICGAWGGCPLPKGHNMGRPDIPENHAAPPAPDPKWVEALEKAMDSSLSPEFQWWESSEERITFILGVVEPLIREQIAAEIEATYVEPRGAVTFARAEATLAAARIARGDVQ